MNFVPNPAQCQQPENDDRLTQLRAALACETARADQADAYFQAIRDSTMWRALAPLRAVLEYVRHKPPAVAPEKPVRASAWGEIPAPISAQFSAQPRAVDRVLATQPGRQVIKQFLQIDVIGHAEGSYSLAQVNRCLRDRLEAVLPGRVRLASADAPVLLAPPDRVRVAISQHYPLHVPSSAYDVRMALFFWEESVVPQAVVRQLNHAFDVVLAPSHFVAKALVDSGVAIPVRWVGQAPDLAAFHAVRAARSRQRTPCFNFLHVSSCFPRKGVDVLLAAYLRAFRACDPVRLVIKGAANPHNNVEAMLAKIAICDPNAPEIVLINDDLRDEELLALYRDADAMVLPSRGEGFNLPAAEAMAAGLALIVTGHGGQMDFCRCDTVRLLAWRHAKADTHVAAPGSLWVEPSEDDLVDALQEAVALSSVEHCNAAAAQVVDMLQPGAMTDRILNAAIDAVLAHRMQPLRLGMVTPWDVRCGVAEYSRHLLSNLPNNALIGDSMVFADARSAEASRAQPRVVIGWQQGDVAGLPVMLAEQNPDVVAIQHQPGLFSWQALAHLLRSPMLAGQLLVVTLHNTADLALQPELERADVVRALADVARVVVHGVADLHLLRGLGLLANVVMIPHGVPVGRTAMAPRAFQRDSAILLGCHGFFLPNKGIPELIAATALLRADWPSLRVRLVCADYHAAQSTEEIARARQMVVDLGLTDAVEFHIDFLPDAQIHALLSPCDLMVLPYQASLEAASGALRAGLAAGVPLAVTPLAVFEDAGSAVARLPGLAPPELAQGIAALLRDVAQRRKLLEAAEEMRAAHAWPRIAERYAGMLQGLRQERLGRTL